MTIMTAMSTRFYQGDQVDDVSVTSECLLKGVKHKNGARSCKVQLRQASYNTHGLDDVQNQHFIASRPPPKIYCFLVLGTIVTTSSALVG